MYAQTKLFGSEGGKTRHIGRMIFNYKMSADDTEGAYTVLEALVPPDSGSGYHRHWSYDEAAFILAGKFECHVDGTPKVLSVGESVYWPRGATHKFRSVGPEVGRILFICSPGRIFEDFIEKVSSEQVETGSAKSGPAIDFRAIASQYGIEFLD